MEASWLKRRVASGFAGKESVIDCWSLLISCFSLSTDNRGHRGGLFLPCQELGGAFPVVRPLLLIRWHVLVSMTLFMGKLFSHLTSLTYVTVLERIGFSPLSYVQSSQHLWYFYTHILADSFTLSDVIVEVYSPVNETRWSLSFFDWDLLLSSLY